MRRAGQRLQGGRTEALRVAVTGGEGFVGGELCALLEAGGREVTSVDRRPPTGSSQSRRRVRVDLGTGSLDWMEGVDAVVHLAGLPGVRATHPPAAVWRDNVAATARVTAEAGRRGIRVVVASSSSVYGDARVLPTPEHSPPAPLSPYARSKAAAERAAMAAARRGADVVVARLFTVFGPRQRPDMALAAWIAAVERGTPVTWSVPPGGARELTYVTDAARGLAAALDRGRAGETYNVAGVGPVPLRAALSEVERALGARAIVRPVGASSQEAVRTAACGGKAARELGYQPAVGLREGIAAQVAATAA